MPCVGFASSSFARASLTACISSRIDRPVTRLNRTSAMRREHLKSAANHPRRAERQPDGIAVFSGRHLGESPRREFSGKQKVGLHAGERRYCVFAYRAEVVNAAYRYFTRDFKPVLRGGGDHLRRHTVVGCENPAWLRQFQKPPAKPPLPCDALKRASLAAGKRFACLAVKRKRLLESAFAVVAPEPRLRIGHEREIRVPRD